MQVVGCTHTLYQQLPSNFYILEMHFLGRAVRGFDSLRLRQQEETEWGNEGRMRKKFFVPYLNKEKKDTSPLYSFISYI